MAENPLAVARFSARSSGSGDDGGGRGAASPQARRSRPMAKNPLAVAHFSARSSGSKGSSSITGYSIDGLPRYASSSPKGEWKTIDGFHVRRDKKGKKIVVGF